MLTQEPLERVVHLDGCAGSGLRSTAEDERTEESPSQCITAPAER